MSWQVIDRNQPVVDPKAPPVLSEAVREKIRSFFPRYDSRRAVLLPHAAGTDGMFVLVLERTA